MADFYPPGYHEDRDGEAFLRRYAAQQARLPSLEGKRVLDVGCARGDFLSYLLGQGIDFEAHGIDAFSAGVKDNRIRFSNGIFDATDYPDGYFDLVMAWAVFEHIHSPTAYFREAARLLRRGGSLVILVTNANSFYGRYAYMEDVPRHTYHYSEQTLAAYGQKSGLSLKRVSFDDDIFDGRGRGTFRRQLGKLVGATVGRDIRGQLRFYHHIALKAGGALDGLIFTAHWEAKLRRSGVMIGHYEKP